MSVCNRIDELIVDKKSGIKESQFILRTNAYYHLSVNLFFLFILGIRGTSTANAIEIIAIK